VLENVCPRERVQKFPKRAGRYIMGYHVLWQIKQGIIQDLESDIKDDRKEAIIPAKLIQWSKKLKHICALWVSTTAFARQTTKGTYLVIIIFN
jgi:hypothetical protein